MHFLKIPTGARDTNSTLCHKLRPRFSPRTEEIKERPRSNLHTTLRGSLTPTVIKFGRGTLRGKIRREDLETFTTDPNTKRTDLSLAEFFIMLEDNPTLQKDHKPIITESRRGD